MSVTKRLYFGSTPYSLLVYLMSCTEQEIDETFFVFDWHYGLGQKVAIPNSYSFPMKWYTKKKWVLWIYVRIIKLLIIPKISESTNIYAQDQSPIASIVIGRHKYTWIEDSRKFLSIWWNGKSRQSYETSVKGTKGFIGTLLFGRVWKGVHANNPQCKALLLTEDDNTPVTTSKRKQFVGLDKLTWQSCSERKQKLILDAFGICDKDIKMLSHASTIFLSQPLDDIIPYADYVTLLQKIISKYDTSFFVIKTHPRDTFDYESLFPHVTVFRKKVPFQLMTMFSTNVERVSTIFSSAVYHLDTTIEIDWFGTKVHPALYDRIGQIDPPVKVCYKII